MLDWGVPDELDADNDLERYVDWYLPRAIAAVRRETGARRGDAGRLLPRRRARGAVRRRPRGRAGAQPDPDGDARRLRRDGRDGRAAARGPAEPRRPDRRHRQRAGRRALQRLLHARADDGDRAEGDAAREPLERRVRRGLPGDGAVVARPRPVPGRRVPRARRAARPRERADDRVDAARRPRRSTSPTRAATCSTRWPSATTSCRPPPSSRSCS